VRTPAFTSLMLIPNTLSMLPNYQTFQICGSGRWERRENQLCDFSSIIELLHFSPGCSGILGCSSSLEFRGSSNALAICYNSNIEVSSGLGVNSNLHRRSRAASPGPHLCFPKGRAVSCVLDTYPKPESPYWQRHRAALPPCQILAAQGHKKEKSHATNAPFGILGAASICFYC
jgi:hypothetical protein